jgi:hypothetical protein
MGLEKGEKIKAQTKCFGIIFNKVRAEIVSHLGKMIMHMQEELKKFFYFIFIMDALGVHCNSYKISCNNS